MAYKKSLSSNWVQFARKLLFITLFVSLVSSIQTKIVQAEELYADHFLKEGLRKLRKGNKTSALQDFNQAIKYNEKFVPAFLERAKLLNDLSRYREAIIDLNEVLKIDRFNLKGYYFRAYSRSQIDQGEGILEDCKRALILDRKDHKLHPFRGLCKGKLGDNQGAIQEYSSAIKLNRF